MAYNVYSLPDCRTVLYHPDVGTANLHQSGHGKITGNAGDDPFRSLTGTLEERREPEWTGQRSWWR